jgi:hypothetical protein
VTGGDHPRSLYPPGVDRLAQRDVEQVTACLDEQSEVTNRGEPGAQRAASVANRAQHPGRRIVLHLRQAGVLAPPAHQQVDLHVHQAGQQDGVAEVDHVTVDSAPDTNYPVAFDTNDSRPDDFAGIDID